MSRGSCCRIAQLDVSSRHVPPLHSAFALRSTRWRVGPGCSLGRAAWCARGPWPAHEPSASRAFSSAHRLEARPGPATAHGHRSQALLTLRRPPYQRAWSLMCDFTRRLESSRALRPLWHPPYQLGRVADVRLCASPRILPCPPAPLAPSIPVGLVAAWY